MSFSARQKSVVLGEGKGACFFTAPFGPAVSSYYLSRVDTVRDNTISDRSVKYICCTCTAERRKEELGFFI